MHIGPYALASPVILAPMAGITDRPFRTLCKQFGAGLAVSEMVAANPALRGHPRTQLRIDYDGEPGLRSVQLLGVDPKIMADAARYNVDCGANIIDINMGCPAKKVCSVAAGSALLRNSGLVRQILAAVVASVEVPVTLKIRTGWDPQHRNAVEIARIAEAEGIAALTIHGRTRACKFAGQAEYQTIRQVKQAVSLPVIANGDIDSPRKAQAVMHETGADAVMVGRAARGNPWLFGQIRDFLTVGEQLPNPTPQQIWQMLTTHLDALYRFYGNTLGVRIARKHIAWYLTPLLLPQNLQVAINQAEQPAGQIALIDTFFQTLTDTSAA